MKRTLLTLLILSSLLSGCAAKQTTPQNTAQSSTKPQTTTSEKKTEAPNPYSLLLRKFDAHDDEAKKLHSGNLEDDRNYCYWTVWNDGTKTTAPTCYIGTKDENGQTIYYGLLTNEDRSRTAVYFIGIECFGKDQFQRMLDTVDFHSEPSDEYAISGYIMQPNHHILVNQTDWIGYFLHKDKTESYAIYELCDIDAMAYVLGIDMQLALSNCTTLTELNTVQGQLEDAIYYGVRGYDSYQSVNPWGVNISNYTDLKAALNDLNGGKLSEVAYLAEHGYSDPTSDPSSSYYEGSSTEDEWIGSDPTSNPNSPYYEEPIEGDEWIGSDPTSDPNSPYYEPPIDYVY